MPCKSYPGSAKKRLKNESTELSWKAKPDCGDLKLTLKKEAACKVCQEYEMYWDFFIRERCVFCFVTG